jgi:hypothetical protein
VPEVVGMSNMRHQMIWRIREARGLSAYQKAMLFVIESTGTLFCTNSEACEKTGLSRTTFYRTRDSLVALGLIEVTQREGSTTCYRVLARGVLSAVYSPVPQWDPPVPQGDTPVPEGDTPVPEGDTPRPTVGIEEDQEEDHEGDHEGQRRSGSSPLARQALHLAR